MMKTIVLRKNQLVLFSVIRFFSQRDLGGNLKMEMPLCSEWLGKRWRGRGIVCMVRSPADRTPFSHAAVRPASHNRICAEGNKTPLNWVIVSIQIITVMWVGRTTPLLLHPPQSSPLVAEILNWSLFTFPQTAVL